MPRRTSSSHSAIPIASPRSVAPVVPEDRADSSAMARPSRAGQVLPALAPGECGGANGKRRLHVTASAERGAQGEHVVGQPLERVLAGAAHLKAADRPIEGTARVGARLEALGEAAQFLRRRGVELVAAAARRRRAGGEPLPLVFPGGGKGIGAEADGARPEEAHDADQLTELAESGERALGVIVDLGERDELRLPGFPAHADVMAGLKRRVDICRARDPHPAGKVEAREGHLQADQRRDEKVGFLEVAGQRVEAAELGLEAGPVDREFGAPIPHSREEGDEHLGGALALLLGNRLAVGIEIGDGHVGAGDGVGRRAEARQQAQLVLAVADETRGQRHVAIKERASPSSSATSKGICSPAVIWAVSAAAASAARR